jgi:hypothetical protein
MLILWISNSEIRFLIWIYKYTTQFYFFGPKPRFFIKAFLGVYTEGSANLFEFFSAPYRTVYRSEK